MANVDISKVYELHTSNASIATLTAVKPMSRFGVLDIGSDGKVIKFKEKPRMDTWINGGYFVFSKEIFKHLDENAILEQEPLSEISHLGRLSAFQHEGFWQPMDTLREAELLNGIWARGEAEWKVW